MANTKKNTDPNVSADFRVVATKHMKSAGMTHEFSAVIQDASIRKTFGDEKLVLWVNFKGSNIDSVEHGSKVTNFEGWIVMTPEMLEFIKQFEIG